MATPETAWLIDTVGDVLSKGVAATTLAQPVDPVEYLAKWLLRYVDNQEQQKQLVQEADEHRRLQKRREVSQNVRVGGAYLAQIAVDEQPWAPNEGDPAAQGDSDADEDVLALVASDAVAGEATTPPSAPTDDGPAADGPALQRDQQADAQGAAQRADYSSRLLTYVAASPGQEFVTRTVLRRERLRTDTAVDGAAAGTLVDASSPATFRVLDEQLPLLHVPVVALERRIRFFKPQPKIGAYCAAAVPKEAPGAPLGSCHAVLAADTLLPEGNGQPFSEDDQQFIAAVAKALGAALDAVEAVRVREARSTHGAGVVASLRAAVETLRAAAAAVPTPIPEVGAAPAVLEAGDEAAPADVVASLAAHLAHLSSTIEAQRVSVANAKAAQDVEQRVLDATAQAIASVKGVGLRALHLAPWGPLATAHVLRAVLLLLGREPASLATWKDMRQHLALSLFEEMAAFDARKDRGPSVWASVRAALHGVDQRKQDLADELPQSHLGILMMAWIKQTRRVAHRTAALGTAEQSLAASEAAKTAAQAKLQAAERAHKAVVDASATKAAEAGGASEAPDAGDAAST